MNKFDIQKDMQNNSRLHLGAKRLFLGFSSFSEKRFCFRDAESYKYFQKRISQEHFEYMSAFHRSSGFLVIFSRFFSQQLTMETLKEFDWCLDQLDTLRASMSISEMASNKFKRLLDRELKDFSETGGSEISAWVFDNFVGKSSQFIV